MRYPDMRLLVFAKAPVPGRVKTRLARRYGRRGAAVVYRDLLCRTTATVATAAVCPAELWVAPHRHPFFDSLAARRGMAVRVQPAGDLGRRMDRALRAVLREATGACIVGGDCAALGPDVLERALRELATGTEAVFVPAGDGGYTLVGLSRPLPGIFQGVPWGTSAVMAATRRRLRLAGARWVELPASYDVDEPADLARLRRERPAAGIRGRERGGR